MSESILEEIRKSWLPNFIIAFVFLLIGPIVTLLINNNKKWAILSAALGLTILIWTGAVIWIRHVSTPLIEQPLTPNPLPTQPPKQPTQPERTLEHSTRLEPILLNILVALSENSHTLYVWHTKMWIWKAAKMAGAACPTLKWQDRKTVGRAVPAIKLARLQHNSRSWCTAHIDSLCQLFNVKEAKMKYYLEVLQGEDLVDCMEDVRGEIWYGLTPQGRKLLATKNLI